MLGALVLILVPSENAFGQLGYVTGEVLDEAGNPVKDVVIRIEGMNITRKYKLKTDKKGKYIHAGVSMQGVYRVIAEKEGYQTDYVENVKPGFSRDEERCIINFKLRSGSASRLDFEMTDAEREQMRIQQEKAKEQAAKLEAVRETFNNGVTAYNGGQYDVAASAFEEVVQVDPSQGAIWANLGNCYNKLNQLDKSLEAYGKAVELEPENPAFLQNMGSVYAAKGETDKARELYEKAASFAAATNPADAAVNYYNMGVTYINAGKNQEAAEALEKAIELDPTHGDSHYQLGITYIGLNKMEDAIDHLKKCVELAPASENAAVAQELIKQLGGQ